MHKRFVFTLVSRIVFLVSLFMFFPLILSFGDPQASVEIKAFGITIMMGLLISAVTFFVFRIGKIQIEQATAKDALAVVGLSWVAVSLWGGLPLLMTGVVHSYTDAVFEVASGFTTTGASIFRDVEVLPRGILFWRSLTHWLGGLGVIGLFIALFPNLGVTSMRLYNLEASGIGENKSRGQLKKTALSLWSVYIFLTVFAVVLLYFSGMPIFDSVCHAFGAIATGGFSTKNASIGAYGPNIQWIIVVVMILGGINFSLYLSLISGRFRKVIQDEEIRLYFALIFCASLACTILLSTHGSLFENVRASVFQVVSLMTATGYATTDFNLWPYAAHAILLMLMFIGGCAGSTSGGFKVVRVLLAFKKSAQSVQQAIYPHGIMRVKLDGASLPETLMRSVMEYFIIFLGLFVIGALLLLSFDSCDIVTATSASISALSSVGPGLGMVGPVQNYAWLSIPSKWTLIFLMLAGRLELYAILVLFIPATWKK